MTLPELEEGQVLVANTVMSVGPCMGGHMNDVASDVAPFEVDAPLDGGGVGTVTESRASDIAVGASALDLVCLGMADPRTEAARTTSTSTPTRWAATKTLTLQGFLLPQHLGPAGEYCEKAREGHRPTQGRHLAVRRDRAPRRSPAADAGETLRAQRDVALMLSAAD